MRAYCQLACGKAMIGSDVSEFCEVQKESMASFGSVPPLYPESSLVNQKRGAAMIAKFLM
jgi:hypothetical protein